MTCAELLASESRSLVERLRVWAPARWAARAPVLGTRADVVHHLAQWLADESAAVEGGPHRSLPRLDSDLALADQLAVTAGDLVRAGPPEEVARRAVVHVLLHRTHLLGEPVPPALADRLGVPDVLAAGATACAAAPAGEGAG